MTQAQQSTGTEDIEDHVILDLPDGTLAHRLFQEEVWCQTVWPEGADCLTARIRQLLPPDRANAVLAEAERIRARALDIARDEFEDEAATNPSIVLARRYRIDWWDAHVEGDDNPASDDLWDGESWVVTTMELDELRGLVERALDRHGQYAMADCVADLLDDKRIKVWRP